MSSIFFNYKNSKTSEPHRLLLNLLGQIDLENMLPSILVSTTLRKKTKKKTKKNSYKNSRFKISTPIRNGKFELHHELCSVLDIQDYFAKNLSKNIDKNTGKKLSGKSS